MVGQKPYESLIILNHVTDALFLKRLSARGERDGKSESNAA
jgi:hypothetical protein